MTEPRVTLQHVLNRGYQERGDGQTWCRSGIRAWCQRYGIDYLELVRDGVPASIFAATDGHGALIAQDAIDDAGGHRGRE